MVQHRSWLAKVSLHSVGSRLGHWQAAFFWVLCRRQSNTADTYSGAGLDLPPDAAARLAAARHTGLTSELQACRASLAERNQELQVCVVADIAVQGLSQIQHSCAGCQAGAGQPEGRPCQAGQGPEGPGSPSRTGQA